MSIQSEVERISTNVQNTLEAIRQTGVSVPESATSDDLPAAAAALANEKQNKLTGTQGQYVGFNSSGEAEAVDPPSSLPEGGSEGKLLGYGTEPEWVDPPKQVYIYQNVVFPLSDWSQSGDSDDKYPWACGSQCATEIAGKEATADVVFSLDDVDSGIFAPITSWETDIWNNIEYEGGVFIYAKQKPTSDVTVPVVKVTLA